MAASEIASVAPTGEQQAAAAQPPSRFWAKVRYHLLNVYAGLALFYLLEQTVESRQTVPGTPSPQPPPRPAQTVWEPTVASPSTTRPSP